MAYFLPLSRKIGLAVRFEYYPAPIFLAERCKSTILTTKWLLAISRWLAFGNPTLLRLGNSNKFDCTRLNRSVSWLRRTENLEVRERTIAANDNE